MQYQISRSNYFTNIPSEECGKPGLVQILTSNYSRCRHYSHLDPKTKRPQFVYHKNSMIYVTEKLKTLSEKSLSSRLETEVVAINSKDGNDQLGQHGNIDLKLQANSSELENQSCRGSLAWLGRQTHNLENNGGQTPDVQRSRARNEERESRPRHHNTSPLDR